jgi:iron complex outermembrane receptor protein
MTNTVRHAISPVTMLVATLILMVSTALASQASAADNPPAAVASSSAAGTAVGIEEIVVTAEKIKSNLHETPAAITALSGPALITAGVTSPLDLAMLVPGVTFRTHNSVTQMFIRGVGSNIDSPQVVPGVATQMNGMYVPREATGGSFYDLENVEVLPGPQGTLYGRDAAGGTVNVNFRRPNNTNETDAIVEWGNYSLVHVTAIQNAAISDRFMVRAAVDYTKHNGYLTNGADDLVSSAARLSALARPTDSLTVLLWGSFWHDGGHGPQPVASPLVHPSDPWFMPAAIPAGTARFDTQLLGSEANWTLGAVTLTYIPGFSRFDENSLESLGAPALALNAPGGVATLHVTQHWTNNSQELRLSSQDDPQLKWLSGLYWYSQDLRYYRNSTGALSGITTNVIIVPDETNSGYAAYGQPTYSPIDWLHFTVGGRVASDSLDVSGLNAGALVPFSLNRDWKHADWKLGIQADLSTTSNVYATVQTGFLRGGYSPGAISPTTHLLVPTTAVEPEKLLSYVIGSKNRFWANRLEINNEIYYYDYKDYQISAIDLTNNVSSFFNAKKVVIYGDQLDTKVLITTNDEANISVAWNHGRDKDFNIPGVGNFNGYSLPNSPEVTIIVGYQHTWTLPSGAGLLFRGDSNHETQSFLLYDHHNGLRQPLYTTTGLSLTYSAASAHWDAALWVKNLENSAIYGAGASVGPIGAPYLSDPRTFGVRFGVHF